MTTQEKTLANQIATFVVLLLLFIGVTSVTDITTEVTAQMDAVMQAQTVNGVVTKPTLQQVGDAAFAPIETGAAISGNPTFIKWSNFAQAVFDNIEQGVGPVISYFKGLIAGTKAAKAEASAAVAKAA